MNWEQIQGNWHQLKGRARAKWADITGDDWDRISGRREEMVGLIQERYGKAKEEAEREVDSWVDAQKENV
jgi:uncharacterized protein YjbJ (UPF0337 family)